VICGWPRRSGWIIHRHCDGDTSSRRNQPAMLHAKSPIFALSIARELDRRDPCRRARRSLPTHALHFRKGSFASFWLCHAQGPVYPDKQTFFWVRQHVAKVSASDSCTAANN